jgi:DNA-binding transcriptional regulator YiaG
LAKKRGLADLIRRLRSELGSISQEQLARRIGVTWSTISRWENGRGRPSPLAREKLLEALEEAGLDAHLDELDSHDK